MVKVFNWKRRIVGFMAVAEERSFRVMLLFGGDRVEKLWNIVIGKAVRGLCLKSSGLQAMSSCQWRLK